MDCFDKTKLIKIRLIDEHFTISTTHAMSKCILNSNVERNEFFMCFFYSICSVYVSQCLMSPQSKQGSCNSITMASKLWYDSSNKIDILYHNVLDLIQKNSFMSCRLTFSMFHFGKIHVSILSLTSMFSIHHKKNFNQMTE